MKRRRPALAVALLAMLALGSSSSAQAMPGYAEIGRVAVSSPSKGSVSILVPVRYGIELAGRQVEARLWLVEPGRGTLRRWFLRDRLSSGFRRVPERRSSFTFVHRLDLGPSLAARLGDGLRLRVLARGVADVDGDGKVDLHSLDEVEQRLRPRSGRTCSSIPRLRLRPGRRASVPLPVCGDEVRWKVGVNPDRGTARLRRGRLVYTAPRRFRGSVYLQLSGRRAGLASASASESPVPADVQITVGTAAGAVVRALGDSVTAGFGYFSNGTPMTIERLPGCRPAAKEFNDACSSNALNFTSEPGKVEYAPDYGLANNVSWAAQWANEHGLTNYKNFAISGSEPKDWAPGGEFHSTTAQIASEDPDYVLMTMGANPLLSEMLFGVDNMGCAVESDITGGYQRCVEEAFAEVGLQEHLKALYSDLVANTDATILLMQYHLSVPSSALAYSATQIAAMGQLLNREIAKIAAEVNPKRLRVVAPPHFNVGIDVSPVYPSAYSCSLLDFEVDGPSVQSTPTQVELDLLHPLSFCPGPAGGGSPWVISGDTGIHPSAAGYTQMASQVPAPG